MEDHFSALAAEVTKTQHKDYHNFLVTVGDV
jgi:hypothetical protein